MPTGVYERKPRGPYKKKKTAVNRFLEKVDYNFNENGCLEWIGSLTDKAYGLFSYNGKTVKAHRFSYELFYEKIPEGMVVMHSCDNPKCVNPNHLSLGTQEDNIRDMINKNRDNKAKGSAVGNSKLTEDQVKEIKNKINSGMKQRDIAKEYKVAPNTISNIKNGISWAHM
jgi:hypothetical protein